MYITKINVASNADAAELTVASNRTLRDVLEESGINYASGLIQYNGAILSRAQLDDTVEELTDDPNKKQILRVTVKAENAVDEACAVVKGGAFIVSSAFTPQQIAHIKKYRPNALKLYEGEGCNKKEIFMIDIGDVAGCLSGFGAVYSTRPGADGKATLTMLIPQDVTDVLAWVYDNYGTALLKLRKTEAQFAAAFEEVENEMTAVADAITFE